MDDAPSVRYPPLVANPLETLRLPRWAAGGAGAPRPRVGHAPPLLLTDAACLVALVGWGLWMLAPHLSHPGIHNWDEALHQAAARGTYQTPLFPHILIDPLFPVTPDNWFAGQVWLNKPTLPFWLGALFMHVVGITPLALRLVSLTGELAVAFSLFFIGRRFLPRPLALAAGVAFLSLPMGWKLTQGVMFGDVTDVSVAGCVAVAMAVLLRALEKDSARWAALAGALVGAGYLCKAMLSVAPLGVMSVLFVAGLVRLVPRVRLSLVLAMLAAAVVVALPWNVYCARTWPEVFWWHNRVYLGHFSGGFEAAVGPWKRPIDGLFNEMNQAEYGPWPVVVPLLGGLWLLARGLWRRRTPEVAVGLWLWASWTMHSLASAKPPALAWHSVGAGVLGVALLLKSGWRRPALALALAGGCLTPWLIVRFPELGKLRALAPLKLEHTRVLPGLAEGLALALGFSLVGLVVALALRRLPAVRIATAVLATVVVGDMALVRAPRELKALVPVYWSKLLTNYTREAGRALDAAVPLKSALFLDIDTNPPEVFEEHNLMLWSGRMAYARPPEPAAARAKGYHPYSLSPCAEPFAPVEVPAQSWLRAYDLDAPAGKDTPLPSGLQPLTGDVPGWRAAGVAWGPLHDGRDRYAVYARPQGVPGAVRVRFALAGGRSEEVRVEPEATLRGRGRLASSAWCVLPVVGPRRDQVERIELLPP